MKTRNYSNNNCSLNKTTKYHYSLFSKTTIKNSLTTELSSIQTTTRPPLQSNFSQKNTLHNKNKLFSCIEVCVGWRKDGGRKGGKRKGGERRSEMVLFNYRRQTQILFRQNFLESFHKMII